MIATTSAVLAAYPKTNDLALEAVHDDNHLTRLRRRICKVLTEHTQKIHSLGGDENMQITNTSSTLQLLSQSNTA